MRTTHSVPVIAIPTAAYLAIFKKTCSNIGTARKNVNSAATLLDTPIMSAPIIVAPDLDVPEILLL